MSNKGVEYRFYKGSGVSGDIFIYNTQGQLMAKYRISGRKLKLNYVPIYEGTRRLGILEPDSVQWIAKRKCYVKNPITGQVMEVPCGGWDPTDDIGGSMFRAGLKSRTIYYRANRKYELTDHLSNVRVVIRDQRMPVPDSSNQNVVAYYKPLIESIHDYYPFGWEKTLTQDPYPFTYQGQLLDIETGWQYYRYRNYDPLIARFYQVEPLIDKYPWLGYVFDENKVTYGVELEGLEVTPAQPAQETVNNQGVPVQNTAAVDNMSVINENSVAHILVRFSPEVLKAAMDKSGRIDFAKASVLQDIWDRLEEIFRMPRSNDGMYAEEEWQEGGIMFTSNNSQWGETRRARNPDKALENIDDLLAAIDVAVKSGSVEPGDIKNLLDAFEIGHNVSDQVRQQYEEIMSMVKEKVNERLNELEEEMKARERAINVYCTLCGGVFKIDTVTKINFGEASDNAKATDTVEGHTQFKRASSNGQE